jgi:alkylation response protein AidB-like acyl-CoA dehydrogenase
MNDLSLTSPVARAHDLARSIATEVDAIERKRRLTEPVLEQLHEARLFRMFYPRSVGGDEVEPAVAIEAVAELARHDGSVGWCVSIANSIGLLAPYISRRRRKRCLATRARPAPGGRRTIAEGSRCRAATGSPGAGISPAAAAMRAGWARTAW